MAASGAQPARGLVAAALRAALLQHRRSAAHPGVAWADAERRLSSAAAGASGQQEQEQQQGQEQQQRPEQQQQQRQPTPSPSGGGRETLAEIRARVFDTALGDGRRSGRRALMRPLVGREVAGWYFSAYARNVPFQEDDIETECVALGPRGMMGRWDGDGMTATGMGVGGRP
jgi:hypothetical protein